MNSSVSQNILLNVDTSKRPNMSCDNCQTVSTPLWRRGPNKTYLCNACGLYYKMHGSHRNTTRKTAMRRPNAPKPKPAKPSQNTPLIPSYFSPMNQMMHQNLFAPYFYTQQPQQISSTAGHQIPMTKENKSPSQQQQQQRQQQQDLFSSDPLNMFQSPMRSNMQSSQSTMQITPNSNYVDDYDFSDIHGLLHHDTDNAPALANDFEGLTDFSPSIIHADNLEFGSIMQKQNSQSEKLTSLERDDYDTLLNIDDLSLDFFSLPPSVETEEHQL